MDNNLVELIEILQQIDVNNPEAKENEYSLLLEDGIRVIL